MKRRAKVPRKCIVWALAVLAFPMSATRTRGQTIYTPYAFANLAGNGNGYRDGTGSFASFSSPTGVAVDSTGNVYVADTGNRFIRKITAEGIVTTLWGTNGRVLFAFPFGVAIDGGGTIYVGDTGGHTIHGITPDGTNWTVTT